MQQILYSHYLEKGAEMEVETSEREQKTIATYNNRVFGEKRIKERSDSNLWAAQRDTLQTSIPLESLLLDLGCGHGRDTKLFSEAGYNCVGVDASKWQLEQAHEFFPKGKFLKANAYKLPFKGETFDAFWAVGLFLHLEEEKLPVAFKELRRVCKPGAIGLIIMKEKENAQVKLPEDRRSIFLYSLEEFSQILQGNGFTISQGRVVREPKPDVWLEYFVKA